MNLRFPVMALAGILLLIPACSTPAGRPETTRPLILVSIDGFRWDYLQKYDAPALQQLAAGGVHAKRLTPSFPTKTFPNHYTLVTGLRPENHGVVSNYYFDPALNASFNKNSPVDNADPRWWAQGEPVWITAVKQGVRSAAICWPGDEAENHGYRPTFLQAFDKKLGMTERVDALLAWLALPAGQRPVFSALYLDEVDIAGHDFGPDSPEMATAVKMADAAIARLLAGLVKLGLRDRTNLVVLSDHGMSEESPDQVVFLEDLMDVSQVQVESIGPNGGVRPKPGTGTAAELAARIRARAPPQLQVYVREEVPERYHYRHNPRIPPVVLIADDHWNIESKIGWPNRILTYSRGNHGWDPATPNMGALFIASGPAFKSGVELDEVENIHVYNLLCATLALNPAPNDGDQRLVQRALRP